MNCHVMIIAMPDEMEECWVRLFNQPSARHDDWWQFLYFVGVSSEVLTFRSCDSNTSKCYEFMLRTLSVREPATMLYSCAIYFDFPEQFLGRNLEQPAFSSSNSYATYLGCFFRYCRLISIASFAKIYSEPDTEPDNRSLYGNNIPSKLISKN